MIQNSIFCTRFYLFFFLFFCYNDYNTVLVKNQYVKRKGKEKKNETS